MTAKTLSAEEVLASPNAQERPGLILGLLETRAFWEFGSYCATLPIHRFFPKGDGHPVMVLPGFATGDGATLPLRRFLNTLGYATYAWNEGLNFGRSQALYGRLHERIATIKNNHGAAPSLVGWSLGGIISRKLAFMDHSNLRSVITLGSPFYGLNRSTNIHALLELARRVRGKTVRTEPTPQSPWQNEPAVPVPFTSLYSRTDGVVTWKTCLEPNYPLRENIHVPCSHMAFGFNPLALYVIADRLSQPVGQFAPFSPGFILSKILR